jgi:hypothetical protein
MGSKVRRIGIVGWLALAGCGGSGGGDGAAPPAPPPTPVRRVMVIDRGFDPSLTVLTDKVLATYTVRCPDSTMAQTSSSRDAGCDAPDAGAACAEDFAASKRALIHELETADDGCRLEQGLPPVTKPLASVESLRPRWNAAISGHRDPRAAFTAAERARLGEALSQLDPGDFHGSATSSIVAYANAGVQLVLVDRPLGTSTDATGEPVTCPTRRELEESVLLMQDPDVRAAYVNSQLPFAQAQIWDAIRTHGIGIVNESFGPPARAALEAMLASSGCSTALPLDAYFAASAELERAAEEAHAPPDVLVVQSAGNEGAEVRGPMDHLECRPGDPRRVLVGSYGPTGQTSSFSNYGPCVDAYAPGENIITSLPGDWLLPLTGTSFSAPLTTRAASRLSSSSSFMASTERQALLAERDDRGRLPEASFPQALIFPADEGGTMQALTVRSPRSRSDAAGWLRLIAPLRWARARVHTAGR